jgi:hypothetical protein
VLLNFWASWSAESRAAIKDLKKVYKKYKQQPFTIYQVALEKNIDRWDKTARFEEIVWPSVIDTSYPNSLIMRTYNVEDLPWNYLIHPNQEDIVGKNFTAGQLDKKLSTLLN